MLRSFVSFKQICMMYLLIHWFGDLVFYIFILVCAIKGTEKIKYFKNSAIYYLSSIFENVPKKL